MAECIEREALLAHLRKCKETSTGSGLTAAVITAIQSFVEGMPLADVAPVVHGRWIHYDGVVICSACGNAETSESYYCNYCGAKMDEKDEDDGQKD